MLVVGCFVSIAGASEPLQRPLPGLSVQQGQLLLQGKLYRGIGVNYFSLFYRTLKDPADTSYEQGLAQLSQAGIPFVRFMAGGFWPVDWELYLNDRDAYFKQMDCVVTCAETNQIGLIPSLFWNMATVPDIVGEHMDQLGNPASKAIAFIRTYTREMVTRYRESPAIWGWELGNEYNLAVDLPNAAQHRPPVWPNLKTALTRTARDELSSEAMLTLYKEFAKTIRTYDNHRILITGNSIPRPSAYHNSKEKSWQKDTREQFHEILLRDNPDPYHVISVHVYPRVKSEYSACASNLTDLLKTLHSMASIAEKPLFVGEFGVPVQPDRSKERKLFRELIRAIESSRIPLAALWVFDHPGQNADWNISFGNERSYMLEWLGKENNGMRFVK
jgi:hypothetical protein